MHWFRSTSSALLAFALIGFCHLAIATAADARPARPAPPLPPPAGTVITVSSEPELQAAMTRVASDTTIVLSPGTYVLTRTLYFFGALRNIGIRGATGNSSDVTLVGPGMTEANYGAAPHGIWTGNGVDGVTIANMTIRGFYFHPIILNGGTQRPHIYNVHLIDAGEQFIKGNPDGAGVGASDGIVEYSIIEFTTTARNDYPKGIDIQGASNWIIRHNLFRNLVAPPGQLIGPAILAWRGTRDTITEGNTFINCGRGVMYGADDNVSPSHNGGIIRNNFFFRSANQPLGDVAIHLSSSPYTKVLNNTVFLSGSYRTPIEVRYPATQSVVIANNIHDGVIQSRDGGTAVLQNNLADASAAMFVDAPAGDLHLRSSAASAIDRGIWLNDVSDDWDVQPRPIGAAPDIGADEFEAVVATNGVNGFVSDPLTGAGISGVTMTLIGGSTMTASTNSSGSYSFSGLRRGDNFAVTPSLAGFVFTPSQRLFQPLVTNESSANFTGVAAVAEDPLAQFVGTDTTTRGTWRGTYGTSGYTLVNDGTSLATGMNVAAAGQLAWTWAASTSDGRALQKAAAADRLAATWYSGGSFTIDVTPGAAQQVALYMVDWESSGRAQTIEVLDPASGAPLDTRTVSAFSGGQYLVWDVTGPVRFRVTRTAGVNAVISGVFLDGGAGPAPGATFVRTDTTTRGTWRGTYGTSGYTLVNDGTSLATGMSVAAAGQLAWTWAASTSDVRALQKAAAADRLAATWYSGGSFTIDVTPGAAQQVALYMVDWESSGRAQTIEVLDPVSGARLDTRTVSAFGGGQYLVWNVTKPVRFRVTRTAGVNAVISGVFLDGGAGPAPGASFVRTDTTTRGTWRGTYGTSGYTLVNDGTSLATGMSVAAAGQLAWTWAASTGDVRALQKAAVADRLAATWYSGGSFTIDVTPGVAQQVALYMVDWESSGRAQTIEVLNPVSGAQLDTRTVSAFGGGQYLVWNVTGPVRFRVTRTGGVNAVISGVFLDGGAGPAPTVSYTYDIVNQFPHDTGAFTQGLELHDGILYESTGLFGASTLRAVNLTTGNVLRSVAVPAQYFAEGLTIFSGKIFQLTWQSGVGFVYDLGSLEKIGEFTYAGEGWGLTHDTGHLIMSDGTDQIRFIDPVTFQTVRSIRVFDAQSGPVTRLNELEYINGEIYANVWQTDQIVRINPSTGRITGWIDLAGLLPPGTAADVLNGIAFDETSGHLLVTGKLWPLVFEITLRPIG